MAGATGLSQAEGIAWAASPTLTEVENAYLEENYIPHALVGGMTQNTREAPIVPNHGPMVEEGGIFMSSILVAYFSASGETARLARSIAKAAQAALLEIKPAQPYTAADLDWHNPDSRSSVEMRSAACRPALAGEAPDLAAYDTVFVGFPIWWYQAPRIIETFLAACDFSGKRVVPFATSGGSGLGRTEEILKKACPAQAVWLPGKRLSSGASLDAIRNWLTELKILAP